MYVYIHICIYIYMYAWVHVYIYIYIYIIFGYSVNYFHVGALFRKPDGPCLCWTWPERAIDSFVPAKGRG